jgi:hypothetical protein
LLLLSVIGLPFAYFGSLFGGCAAQGIGQPCSQLNNNDDCALGLVCTSKSVLMGSSDICCLPSGNTDPSCIPGTLGTGGGDGGLSTGGTGGTGVGGTGGTGTGGTGGNVSTDPVVSLSAASAFEYDTHLALSSGGALFVAWLGSPALPDGGSAMPFVGYTVSSDGGKTFDASQVATTPGGRLADHPTLAADAQNNVYLAWLGYTLDANGAPSDTHVYVAVAPAGAKTFNAPVEASDPTGGFTYGSPKILVTPAGSPLVTFQRSGATDLGIVAARSADMGATWTTSVVATDKHLLNDRDLPSPCASAVSGRVFVTYFSDDAAVGTGVGIGWSDDDGVTWVDPSQTPEVDQPDTASNDYAVRSTPQCVAVEDAVRVIYAFGSSTPVAGEWQTFGYLAYAESVNGGATFGTNDTKLLSATGTFLNPQLIGDPAGGYDLSYYEGSMDGDTKGAFAFGRSAVPMPLSYTPATTVATVELDLSRTDELRLGDYTGLGATSTSVFMSYVANEAVNNTATTSHVRVHVAPIK